MAKPKAAQRSTRNGGDKVMNSKVKKKTPRPRARSDSTTQLKQIAKAKQNAIAKQLKQNGSATHKLPKPGQFVRAPPISPEAAGPASESNSEDEEYIDKFFDDVDVDENEQMSESSSQSEPSEEDDEEDAGEEEEDEEMDSEEEISMVQAALGFGNRLECDDNEDLEDEEESSEEDSGDEEESSDADSNSSGYEFSPSDVILDPTMFDYDASLNYDDGEEISIESYSESPTSSSESDPDEYVEGNCRFVDIQDGSNIKFPNENGASIVELENDSDECPELVPIPEAFKNAPPLSRATENPAPKKRKISQNGQVPEGKQLEADPADLDFYMSRDFSSVLLHLKSPVYVHGLLSVKVIAGCVDILYHVRPAELYQEISLMATVDDYPVKVANVPSPSASFGHSNWGDVLLKKFHYSHVMEIKKSFREGEAVLLLRSIDENHIKFMQGHMSKKVLPEEFRKSFESSLKCKFYRNFPKLFSPVEHLREKRITSKSPRVITVGGKNTGKSTFNKCLVNSLLSEGHAQVLYIDLDIGQPEFGPPQTISAYLLDSPIIGRGFLQCHATDPYYALVYGHLNVALDPVRYRQCVKALFDHLHSQSDVARVPWVVNTMGYVRGVGLDLMHFIFSELEPTRVLQFRHPQHHLENFPTRLDSTFMRNHEPMMHTACSKTEMDFEWQSVHGFACNRTEDVRQLKGSEGRQMNILSHLGAALNKNYATTLNEVQPICAPLDQLRIINVSDNRSSNDGNLLEAINGNMVYLCRLKDPARTHELEYFGLGMVRAVDEHVNKIYLVTGMKRSNLRHVNCLALTSIPLPMSILTTQSTTTTRNTSTVPYICRTGAQSVLFRNIIDRPYRTEAASKR